MQVGWDGTPVRYVELLWQWDEWRMLCIMLECESRWWYPICEVFKHDLKKKKRRNDLKLVLRKSKMLYISYMFHKNSSSHLLQPQDKLYVHLKKKWKISSPRHWIWPFFLIRQGFGVWHLHRFHSEATRQAIWCQLHTVLISLLLSTLWLGENNFLKRNICQPKRF